MCMRKCKKYLWVVLGVSVLFSPVVSFGSQLQIVEEFNTEDMDDVLYDVFTAEIEDVKFYDELSDLPFLEQSTSEESGVKWNYDTETNILTISGNGPMPNYQIDMYGDTTAPWWNRLQTAQKIVIEDGVTSIGHNAFYNCNKVKEIVIGDDVTSVGVCAFDYSNEVTKLTVGKSLQSVNCTLAVSNKLQGVYISDLASWSSIEFEYGTNPLYYTENFYLNNEKITDLVIPEGVQRIGKKAFGSGSFNSISIPDSVTSIGEGAFQGCKNIKEIIIPDGVTQIEDSAFLSCKNITKITLPENLKSIGDSAFSYCGIEEIVIPDNVISIEGYAFNNCQNLKRIILSKNLETLGTNALARCGGLLEITIPEKVLNIPDSTFVNCTNLKSIQFNGNLIDIGDSAFSGCTALNSINLPDSIVTIGEKAFENCAALTEITIPGNTETIGNYAFSKCSNLTGVTLGGNVSSIGNYAFSECSNLAGIILTEKVSSIGKYAFNGCSKITSLIIPASMSTLGDYAFNNCPALSEVTFLGDAPAIAANTFRGVKATCTYPAGNTTYTDVIITDDFGGDLIWTYEGKELPDDFYKCGENVIWNLSEDGTLSITGTGAMYDYSIEELNYAPWYENRASILDIQIGEGITRVGNAAFYYCQAAKKVSLPETLMSIGDKGFQACSKLDNINFPASVTEIGSYGLAGCKATKLVLPERLTTVGTGALGGVDCTSIILPDSLTYISDSMFANCYDLQDVTFSKNMTSIGNKAFYCCFNLRSVVLPEGLVSIGDNAFQECGYWMGGDGGNAFRSVTLPNSIRSIGSGAFVMCESLGSINLPYGLEELGYQALYWSGIGEVEIPSTVKVIPDYLLGQCRNLKKVTFRGNAPTFEKGEQNHFLCANKNVVCFYPADNDTWTQDIMLNYDGRDTVWTQIGMAPEGPGEGGSDTDKPIKPPVDGGGSDSGMVVTPPDDGWKEGNNTFSVASDVPCIAMLSNDGGVTYTRLTATKISGGYSFTAENMTADSQIVVRVAGDVNGDGIFSNSDITKLRAAYAGKITMDAIQNICSDVNGDGNFTNADITKLQAAYAGKTQLDV